MAIGNSVQMLGEEGLSSSERDQIVQVVRRQTSDMERMLADLLDTSETEAGRLQLKKTENDLYQVLEDAVFLHRQESKKHIVIFTPRVDRVKFLFDKTRITQVINNLLSNAIKYSPEGGKVEVTLNQEGQTAIFCVDDEGVGISDAEKPFIFEPFQRMSNVKEGIAGFGLGLPTSKQIVNAHGGEIQVKDRKPHGSSFVVKLPMKKSEDT